MSKPLLTKSQENLDSARFLINKGHCDSSIHCSYYACLQAIKQILYDELGEPQLESMLLANDNRTHWYLTKEIATRYSQKTGKRYKDVKDTINKVKQARKEADYEKRHFTDEESDNVLKDATDLIDLLQKTFKKP